MMSIRIIQNGKAVAEFEGQAAAASYLGWTTKQVSRAIYSGKEINGFKLRRSDVDADGMSGPVLVITPKGVTEIRSLKKCAEDFNMSRTKLLRLIETGATADDGITTFDFPCK